MLEIQTNSFEQPVQKKVKETAQEVGNLLYVTVSKNQLRLSKNAMKALNAEAGDSVIIIPDYINQNYFVGSDILEGINTDDCAIMNKETILKHIDNKRMYLNLSDEDRVAKIAQLSEELNDSFEYIVPSFIYIRKSLPTITLEEYENIPNKYDYRKLKDKIVKRNSISTSNAFTNEAWIELGGNNEIKAAENGETFKIQQVFEIGEPFAKTTNGDIMHTISFLKETPIKTKSKNKTSTNDENITEVDFEEITSL